VSRKPGAGLALPIAVLLALPVARLKAFAREPLVHFLLIGAGIYGLYGISSSGVDYGDERTITVSGGDLQALSDRWSQVWNRPPTESDLAGVIDQHVRGQILYREGLAMGLDVGDVVIERRLAQKLERLAKELVMPPEPSIEELQAWYAEHPDHFKRPDLYTLVQIYFSPDERGNAAADDARKTLETIRAIEPEGLDLRDYGDRLMLRPAYQNVSQAEIAKLFGAGFARVVIGLEPGLFSGPIESGFGVHLVRLDEVMLRPRPSFDSVRAQIREAWIASKIDDLSERFISERMARYEIIIKDGEAPVAVATRSATP
jgi:peptidyl-prolyl cis-trans isomerase C